MMQNNPHFTNYPLDTLQAINPQNNSLPFKDHPQLTFLTDALARMHKHHAVLLADFSKELYPFFLQALMNHLSCETTPKNLRNAQLIHLDLETIFLTATNQNDIENDLLALQRKLAQAEHLYLIAIYNDEILATNHFLIQHIQRLLVQPKCRLVLMTPPAAPISKLFSAENFTQLTLNNPSEIDILLILRQRCIELENFHHISIPEELLSQTYSLAQRFLNPHSPLEQTFLLLDSSAAHARNSMDDTQQKPTLTIATVTNVLSTWTQIPAAHLILNKFKASDFTYQMQQRVLGQDTAIYLLGNTLQKAYLRIEQRKGPFCSFIFAGQLHTGKKTTTLAMVEQLFKQLNVIYFAKIKPKTTSLLEMSIERYLDKQPVILKSALRSMPYAVFVFDNIDEAPSAILEQLNEIVCTGQLQDEIGQIYYFQQSILILLTNLGADHLTTLAHSFTQEETVDNINLMQLVMREQQQTHLANNHHLTPQEIAAEITPEIAAHLPPSLSQQAQIVPFLPLTKTGIENILHLKIKLLSKQLESRYGVELGYAPEVIRYLTQQTLASAPVNIQKALHQLYFCVEQAIISHADKSDSTQLFLKLNETGQLLRCD